MENKVVKFENVVCHTNCHNKYVRLKQMSTTTDVKVCFFGDLCLRGFLSDGVFNCNRGFVYLD